MGLYYFSIALHLMAVTVWIGHMLFWSVVVGPMTNRFEPPATGKLLRELSVRKGGLGWPCLGVLTITGTYILHYKGFNWHYVVSGEFFKTPYGYILALKLVFVGGMIIYQIFIGHRRAPKLIYADILAAVVVIALSILLTRSAGVGNPYWDFKLPRPYLKGVQHEDWQNWQRPQSLGNVKLIVKSPEFYKVVSQEVQLERIACGFEFVEGPVFDHQSGYLLFSDIPANRIYKWTPGAKVTVYRDPSGKANGLAIDKTGRLIAAEHLNRRISLTAPNGNVVTLAAHYNGKKLNSPNDVAVKSDGSIHFTDPPYGLIAEYGSAKVQELKYQGVYRIDSNDRSVSILSDDLSRPNGLAFSIDEKTLYVSEHARKLLMAFDVKEDGTLGSSRIFAKIYGNKGEADGVKVDSRDNVYMAGSGGIWVWDKHGRELGIILTPERAANMNWGDPDRQTLYITASTCLYRLRLNVPGPHYYPNAA